MDRGHRRPICHSRHLAACDRSRPHRDDRSRFAALFHWIATVYEPNTAYAAIAGLLLGLSLVGAFIAVWLLKRSLPPVPRPRRDQTRAARRSLANDAILMASVPRKALLKADPATEIMIGLAAACLVGWLVSSRLGQSRARDKAK